MKTEIKVPSVGESISEVTISLWLKKSGERVEQDSPICEIESDKATVELIAEQTGVLTVLVEEGTTVTIGTKIGEIQPGDDLTTTPPSTNSQTLLKSTETTHPAMNHPSPAAKKILAEKNIDPTSIIGSGRDGRITKEDAIKANHNLAAPTTTSPSYGSREKEEKKMSPIRKTIAKRLVEAKNTTAMLTTFNEVDMHAIMNLRKKYQDQFIKKHDIKLGFMSLFTKALTESIKSFPAINAIISGDQIIYHHYADVGIAVSTPKGLVVPVIRNAESLGLADIEKEIVRLATKAKQAKLSIDEMIGGTITITNGGIFGSMLSTPILNIPQSAILGMHNIVERPVAINGQVVIRPIMYLALSYDHRTVDGRESVGFLKSIKESIEDPAKMLLNL